MSWNDLMRRRSARSGNGGSDLSGEILFERLGTARYRLLTEQRIAVDHEIAFAFFSNPRNLEKITPPRLYFRILDPERIPDLTENAEFYYRIRLIGVPFTWSSRIVNVHPPREFTDIQLRGPYRSWRHRHIFEPEGSRTLIRDEVNYEIPLGILGDLAGSLLVKSQLQNIFQHRSRAIREWGEYQSRGDWGSPVNMEQNPTDI